MATTNSTPFLVPSPDLSARKGRQAPPPTIKDLLTARQRNSPIPPPSPALSESGFSTWESPATLHSPTFASPTFHFEAHHHPAFSDEPLTPDLRQQHDADEEGGTVVFDPSARHEGDEEEEEEEEDDLPLVQLRPRIASGAVPPSPSSFNDGLSIQSLTITDGFSTCSPSPSIASVRVAKITKVPHSRLSMGTSSILSESVEDAPEGTEEALWDAKALARTSFVDRLPQDLAAILQENERVEAESAVAGLGIAACGAAEPATAPARPLPPTREAPPPPPPVKEDQEKENKTSSVPKSASKESELSSESWKAHLDEAVQQLSPDPAIKPEADAMQRMKSILGPKTRLISKAPWDGDATVEEKPLGFSSRRSMDMLSHHASPSIDKSTSKSSLSSKERQKEAAPSIKSGRTRSFSILSSKRPPAPSELKEQEEALKGLGLGLSTGATISGSDSKRSLKSLLKASATLAESESLSEFVSSTPPQTIRAAKHSSPAALPFPSRPITERSDSLNKVPKASPARISPPVVFEMVTSTSPLASPTAATPPKSAPATVTVFPEGDRSVARSGSKASLSVMGQPAPKRNNSGNTASPSPSTPSALSGFLSNPSSPGPGSPSYFTSVPGSAPINRTTSPSNFGHKLISLEEARRAQETERAAAAARTRESTAESLHNRRGQPAPASIQTSPPAPAPAPAPTPVLAQPKALKPKKSGFLKRMMGGGGDKHERPEMPSAPLPDSFRSVASDDASFRPSLSSSASIPTLSTYTPPSSLSRATGLKMTESPSAPGAGAGRVSFMPTPPTDPNQRIRKGAATAVPALSLRPVSMAFSAGLPSDFLAASPASAVTDKPASPPLPSSKAIPSSRSASSSTSAAFVASPGAASFQSSTSTLATPSLFDEPVPASGSTTPLTPAFLSTSLSSTTASSSGDEKASDADRLAALQDDFARAKLAWKKQQRELESQIRALQIELEKQREETAAAVEAANAPVKEGEKCDRCGSVVAAAGSSAAAKGGEALASTSVMQRPRFKGQGGVGTLFGSGVAA
ncbi:hypothetical protein JCM6882_006281 [Rhodosporidiobolus microsporus]